MRTPLIGTNSPLERLRSRTRQTVSDSPKLVKKSAKKRVQIPLSGEDSDQLSVILEKPMDYIDSDQFRSKKAEKEIYEEGEIESPDVTWYRPLMDDIVPGSKTSKVKPAKQVILSAAQESVLFLKMNYARFRIREIQDVLGNSRPELSQAREILKWFKIAEKYRKQIAETNLALVLAMAKRTRMNELDFADLISEGNMALLRSVDKFDCGRGFKFSTYACRAILKAFSRHGMKFSKYRQRFPADFDPAMEKSNHLETLRAQHVEESAAELRHVVLNNQAELSEVEQVVIHHRFGIDRDKSHVNLTLEQVGQLIGVTKERVRQVQNKALNKIRIALSETLPDDVTLSEN